MFIKLFCFVIPLLLNIRVSESGKILGIFPICGNSHFTLGNEYLRALAEAGHNVTIVSPFEDGRPTTNGSYRNIVLDSLGKKHSEISKAFYKNDNSLTNFYFILHYGINYFTSLTEEVMSHPKFQEFIKFKENYDVVVVPQFFIEGLKILAHHFNAHLIVLNNGEPNLYLNSQVRNPSPLSYIPELWLGYPSEMTILQKLHNVIFSWYIEILIQLYMIPIQEAILKKYFPDAPPLKQIIYNTSLVLVNSHESFDKPIPYVPVMIPVGGFHLKSPKPLPNDLKSFLDNASDGFIFFSLGSTVKSNDMSVNKREIILKVLGKFQQKILWKYENDSLPGKPDNVKISKWLPQNDILAHPNLKVFITQGGQLSTTEALYHGVPIIALPIFSDQEMNSWNAVQAGYCISLPFYHLSEEALTVAINEMLSNSKYSKAAQLRSKILKDRPVHPMKLAVWWTEYVIRHNGAKHLRVAGLDLPWYSYYSIDVYATLVLIIFAILFIFLKVLFYILSYFRNDNLKIKLN